MNILLIVGLAIGGLCVFLLIVWVALWFVDKIPDDYDLGNKKEKHKTKKELKKELEESDLYNE